MGYYYLKCHLCGFLGEEDVEVYEPRISVGGHFGNYDTRPPRCKDIQACQKRQEENVAILLAVIA